MANFISRTFSSINEGLVTSVRLFPKSYELIKSNLTTFILLYSVSAAATVAATISSIKHKANIPWNWENGVNPGGSSFNTHNDGSLAFAGTLLAVVTILILLFEALASVALVQAASGKKVTIQGAAKRLFSNWLWARLIVLSLITALAVILGIFALVIPGIYLLSRLYMSSYIMIDQDTNIEKSISRSWDMGKGNFWKIMSILIVSILLSLTTLIPYAGLLVSFLLATAYAGAMPLRYFELKRHK